MIWLRGGSHCPLQRCRAFGVIPLPVPLGIVRAPARQDSQSAHHNFDLSCHIFSL